MGDMPDWEPIQGFVPHEVKPPASRRWTPRRCTIRPLLCFGLIAGICGVWMMGKLILGLWLITTIPNTSSKNELVSTNSTLNHNASFADRNQSDRTASLPTSSLQSGQLERLAEEVELEIKQLAKYCSYK